MDNSVAVVLAFVVTLITALVGYLRVRKVEERREALGDVATTAGKELGDAAIKASKSKTEAVTKLAEANAEQAHRRAVDEARKQSRVTSLADYLNSKRRK